MSVDATTFKTFLPEFASVADATVTMYILQASYRVSVDAFGVMYDQALMFMTGHLLTVVRQGGAAAGGIRGEGVGSLSRQYGGASLTSRSNLDTTAYGKELLSLMRLNCSGGYAVGTQANCGGC